MENSIHSSLQFPFYFYQNIENSYFSAMSKVKKGGENADSDRNGLNARLQQIVELLYKHNDQFPKGLPCENQFREMLSHCYTCYDQLDFIILEYSRHPVNYLEPKIVAEHMQRIMRVTKYLVSNVRHWVESYSLDIVKKVWESKNYFPIEAAHQARCSSCNRYVQEIVLKEAKEEIFGFQNARELYQQELKETQEEAQAQKPLVAQETEYVGSVNYLTKIIKELEESAHGYSKLTETIERDDNQDDMALRYLQDLLCSMKRRLGEKCIYRLKRVIKNWEKNQNQDHQHYDKKGNFMVKRIFNQFYTPPLAVELKKNSLTSTTMLMKKLKDQNHQLQIENSTLTSTYNVVKNNLTFLEKRQQIQKREMQRLNDLLAEKSIEKNTLANELRASRRDTINPQVVLTINSPKVTSTANNTFPKQKLNTKKIKGYSKFKVKRMSRQSEAFSNGTDKTLDFTSGENLAQNQTSANIDCYYTSDEQELSMIDVGCQWQDPNKEERTNKLKDKLSRTSKLVKSSNKQRMTVQKITKIDEEQEEKRIQLALTSKDNRRSIKAIDINIIKSKTNLTTDKNRLSLEDQKLFPQQNNTLNQLIDTQQSKMSHLQLNSLEQSRKNHKVSVKLLEDPSTQKVSLQKINIYGNYNKIQDLKSPSHQKKVDILKGFPDANRQNTFSRQIKKFLNHRISTQGNQVKRRAKLVRNSLFKPQHLSMFGGVSQSYAFQKSAYEDTILNQQQKRYYSELRTYLINLRGFKNNLYDNIVMFLKYPFTLIDVDEMENKIVGDKELNAIIKKFIVFHSKKCEKIVCDHLVSFNILIGLSYVQ